MKTQVSMAIKVDSKILEVLTSETSGTVNNNKEVEEKNFSTHLKTFSTLAKKKPTFLNKVMM